MLRLPQNAFSNKGTKSPHRSGSNEHEDAYSPAFNLAFGAIRYFFLFLVGLAIAHIFFAVVHATEVVDVLLTLGKNVLPLAGILTFSIFAIVVFTESFK